MRSKAVRERRVNRLWQKCPVFGHFYQSWLTHSSLPCAARFGAVARTTHRRQTSPSKLTCGNASSSGAENYVIAKHIAPNHSPNKFTTKNGGVAKRKRRQPASKTKKENARQPPPPRCLDGRFLSPNLLQNRSTKIFLPTHPQTLLN